MTDVFISYSRKDKAFVQVLNQALTNSKYDAWVDWEDIPLTADWWEEIKAGIEGADTFIFVISPDSIASKVCGQEIDHAVENNKRLLPIVYREGFDMSRVRPALGKHNWLFFKDDNDFDVAFQSLVHALNTDLDYVKTHTRLLVRALEWEKKQRSDDFLLRGSDLEEAEIWLTGALTEHHELLPTEQHKNYITKSREVEDARRRLTAAGEKAKRLVRIGAGILAGTVAIAAIVGSLTIRQLQQANLKLKSAELEQTSLDALQQFEFEEIEALVTAMKAGQDLQAVVNQRSNSADYLAHGTVVSILQQILDTIHEKHAFPTEHGFTSGVAYSPDGKIIATSSVTENKAVLWDLQGNQLAELIGHQDNVFKVEFSPDGKTLATASADGLAKLWDLQGQEQVTFEGHGASVRDIAFSPNGQQFITASWDNTARIWNLQGELLQTLKGHQEEIYSVSVSLDGQLIVTGSDDGQVKIWNFAGKNITTFNTDSHIREVKFSPDGNFIAVAANPETNEGVGSLWNLEGKPITQFKGHTNWVFAIDFSPDGNTVITSSSDRTTRLWSLQGKPLHELRGQERSFGDFDLSPDGQELVTVSWAGTVHRWKLNQTDQVILTGHDKAVQDVAVSPDGKNIATASTDGTVRWWSLSGELLKTVSTESSPIESLDLSPNGKTIVAALGDGTVRFWGIEEDSTSEFQASQQFGLSTVQFSPNEEIVITAGYGNAFSSLWDLEGNLLTTLQGHTDVALQAVFHPTEPIIATASRDGTVKLWDFQGSELQTLQIPHKSGFYSTLDFSPDGKTLAVGSTLGHVELWDLQGKLLDSFQAHVAGLNQLRFSPDGRRIATASEDSRVRLWDWQGRRLGEFVGHKGGVRGLAFTPDGSFLATAANDNTARIWKIERLEQLLVRGCEWLHDYLINVPSDLLELEVCQTDERLAAAAPALVRQGEEMAKAGDIQTAVATFQTVLEWNPDLALEPMTRAKQFQLLAEGEALAKDGHVQQAVTKLQAAMALDQTLAIHPENRAEEIALNALSKKVEESITTGDIQAAIAAFSNAKDINPDFQVSFGTLNLINTLNALCWHGSLHGYAVQVLDACEQAVARAPANGGILDSRGLARALTGDIEGAIADFQVFVDWTDDDDARLQRQEWIKALKAGKTPFTSEVLKSLN
ncbi:MAG: TIR domain-containing protein [Cyanobacteria bacterium P01_B01_bin.77]